VISDPQALLPYFRVRTSVYSVNQAVMQVLTTEPRRIAVYFVNHASSSINLWTDATVSTTKGITLQTGEGAAANNNLSLVFKDYGGLVQWEWYAYASGSSSTLDILEVLYTPPQSE
jgi:hypothetical protein